MQIIFLAAEKRKERSEKNIPSQLLVVVLSQVVGRIYRLLHTQTHTCIS